MSIVSTEILDPYAKALMSLAKTQELTERFGEDSASLIRLLDESEELRQFLASPLTRPDAKKAVLRQIVGEQIHPYMLNFLLLLVDRGRILFLEGICKQYQALLRELNQTVLAEVTSAVELNEEQQESVRQKVVNLVGATQVELDTKIDPDLIGGVIIKVGSQVIDASLRGQLRRIGLRLSTT
ncbi:F0F1 ATP synthase subunit delta [Oculatella sp. LEGE 06141]|uniref:ATP synthase F1 subunit delta n=1 Tax=Oculatella sp. LEGE 06141 TaxID=1828648 RepID=UPI001882199D|nr:ATP synthase F1 subunit delta [Oculatella sp. LEGE 06141]MBE9179252.1 F0F1 ATP synthase subunit delta [Oculatella sp. LEGE 06141]